MIATIEISMYALSDDYAKKIIAFIKRVRQYEGIRSESNGLSTHLIGEYELLIDVLKKEMHQDLQNGKNIFLLKIGRGELTKENLPQELKE
jgi:hypothetical protein